MVQRIVADRYQLGEIIAESRTVIVYEALDLHLRRRVSIKMLNPEEAGDPDRVQRFLDDARSDAALAHPNIAATYDVGTEDGVPYAISEQVDGELLSDLIRNSAPLKPESVRKIGADLAAALDYAQRHEETVYSVRPEEVIVGRDHRAKILGLRSRMGPSGDPPATALLRAGENGHAGKQDVSSAIQSLGIILYRMATGRSPLGEDREAFFESQIAGRVVRPSLHNPSLPSSLERVIVGSLETGPSRRYRTFSDLSLALQVQDLAEADEPVALPWSPLQPARMTAAVEPDHYRGGPSAAAVLIPTLLLAVIILGAVAAGTSLRPRLEVPDVAGFVSGPNPDRDRDQRAAQAAATELEKAIATVRGNTQRVNTMLSGVRDRASAERSIVDGMGGLVDEMRRDAAGGAIATVAAKRQALDLSYRSLETARAGFDTAARDLESRIGPMAADTTRAEDASSRLEAVLAEAGSRIDVQPRPGDEIAAISEFISTTEGARREIEALRDTDFSLLARANSLREQAATLPSSGVAPQATSTPLTARPGAAPTPGPGQPVSPQAASTPRPSDSARPSPTARPGETPQTAPSQPATATPSRAAARPTAPPSTSQGQFSISSRFVPLSRLIPAQVGQATGNVRTDPATGDVSQETTGGVLIWRKATNRLYFTDGFATWVVGPNGLEFRHNDELLDWERATNR